jgi:hypothetical protein
MSLAPRINRTVPRSVAVKRPGDSARHVELIKTLACCIPGCESQTSEPHHLMRVDNLPKGTGRRSEDRWLVPLCFNHHRRTVSKTDCAHGDHGDDEAWMVSKGVDGRALAQALWRNRDSEEACHRLVDRVKQRVNAL